MTKEETRLLWRSENVRCSRMDEPQHSPASAGLVCGRLQTMSNLREMSDDELASWIAGWKPETRHYIAGMRELRRRESKPASTRAWVAIGIAALALIISLIALFK